MTINLFEILQNILNEGVSSNIVNDAIDNKYQVEIKYNEPGSHAVGKRIIEPYAYGISPDGNEVIRAFQYIGDTKRGVPKWKLFRLDRITSWNPTQNKFNLDNKIVVDKFKGDDMGMSNVINIVNFDNDEQISNNTLDIMNNKITEPKQDKHINKNDENDIFNRYNPKNQENKNIQRGPIISKNLKTIINNDMQQSQDDTVDSDFDIDEPKINNVLNQNSYNNE